MNNNESVIEYLTIHTSERNRELFPNAGNCVIRLTDTANKSIKKVKRIRFLGGVLPAVNGTIILEPFLILNIKELSSGHINTNHPFIENAFTILQLDRPLQNDAFINLKGDFNCISAIKPNISTINQLSIVITKQNGEIFDFNNGTQDNGINPDPSKNLHLMFQIERQI